MPARSLFLLECPQELKALQNRMGLARSLGGPSYVVGGCGCTVAQVICSDLQHDTPLLSFQSLTLLLSDCAIYQVRGQDEEGRGL